jgi:hypothetical protein
MTKMTKMTNQQAIVLAAIFARSNMGHGESPEWRIKGLMANPKITLSDAVLSCCGDLMETDEHQQMFEEEARGWYKDFKRKSIKNALKPFRDHQALAKLIQLLT